MNKKWICGIIVLTLLFGTAGFAGLPAQAAQVPVQENIIFDDFMRPYTRFEEDAADYTFASKSVDNVYDTSRICKKDAEKDADTYITYKSADYPMLSVEIRAAFLTKKVNDEVVYTDDFVIKASPDGQEETYADVTLPDFEIHGGTEGWAAQKWREGFSKIDSLPENTHYLRIYFPPTVGVGLSLTDTQLGKVAITTAQPPVQTLAARIAWAEEFYNAVCSGEIPAVYSYDKAKALKEALAAAKAAGTTYDAVCAALEMLTAAQKAFADTVVQKVAATFVDECTSLELAGIKEHGNLSVKVPGAFVGLNNMSGGQDQAPDGKKGECVYSVDKPFGDYVFYEVDDAKTISNLILEIARETKGKNRLLDDMVIMAAPAEAYDGTTEGIGIDPAAPFVQSPVLDQSMVTALPYAQEQMADFVPDTWERHRLTVPMVPKGTKYIFVGFPDMSTQKTSIMMTSIRWTALETDSQFTAGDYKLKQTYAGDGKAAFTVTYTGDDASKNVNLVAAAYKDGMLMDASLASAVCEKDVPAQLTTEAISAEEGSDVRVFLWDGATLSPLVETIE